MPRDNAGELEGLEGPYSRLEAQFGSWQSAAVRLDGVKTTILILLYPLYCLI